MGARPHSSFSGIHFSRANAFFGDVVCLFFPHSCCSTTRLFLCYCTENKRQACFLQENDYMSLLFHLYDSDHEADDEEDGDEARPDTIQMALLR